MIISPEYYLSNSAKQAKVKEIERQIDKMVYQLYGLTPEEIAIIEGASAKEGKGGNLINRCSPNTLGGLMKR